MLLERHCAGTCTPDEQAALESWIADDPRRRVLVERLRTLFGEKPPAPDQVDVERAWTKLTTAIDSAPNHRLTIATLLAVAVTALLGIAWFVARHATH